MEAFYCSMHFIHLQSPYQGEWRIYWTILLNSTRRSIFLLKWRYFLVCFFYSAEIAKRLPEDSFGLIFGINTFVAYCLQSVLTGVVVTDSFALDLSIFEQFNVYGSFYAVLALVYLTILIVDVMRQSTKPVALPKETSQNVKRSSV